MKKSVLQPLCLALCAGLILCSCATSSKNQRSTPAPEEKNRGPALSDPARSYAIVSQGVQQLFPELTEKLRKHSAIFAHRDSVSIKMYINPLGSIDLIGFVEKISLGAGNPLQNFLFRQVIDSSLHASCVTKAVIHAKKMADNAIALLDTIDVSYVDVRSRDDILMLISFNKSTLGKEYARRWAQVPGLQGTITLRFGINEHGAVVFTHIVSTTMNDPVLEQRLCDIVKRWQFGEINNPGDVTEVVYPFVFNQE
jgi:hypothetical protein